MLRQSLKIKQKLKQKLRPKLKGEYGYQPKSIYDPPKKKVTAKYRYQGEYGTPKRRKSVAPSLLEVDGLIGLGPNIF